jgi:hypothetical protein
MSACHPFVRKQFPKRLASLSVVALSLISWSSSAFAYRPFDGTDAAVAASGEVEIELQPAGPLRERGSTTLIAPAMVYNYGFSEGWEAVLEGQGETSLSPSGPTGLTTAGAFLSVGPRRHRVTVVWHISAYDRTLRIDPATLAAGVGRGCRTSCEGQGLLLCTSWLR